MSEPNRGPDHNLLHGLLALQSGLVTRDALIEGLIAWASARGGTLLQVLVARGALAPDDLPPIEHAARRQAERHGGDPSRGLTELDFDLALSGAGGGAETQAGGEARPDRDATTVWGPTEPALPGGDGGQGRSEPPRPRFRALRPHAQGGLGEVHVAWDEELGRYVALKEIRAQFADSRRARARFVREAEVNGNLEHPGIVPVYGLGTRPGGRPYYAMRFVQGETLQDALERFHKEARGRNAAHWTLNLRRLLRRFLHVCDAVEYAHSRGVLHRDLKPANVLLGKFGESLIIDWGLAKVVGRPDAGGAGEGGVEPVVLLPVEGGEGPTLDGETLGSPPYMSPEQARGNLDEVSRASDVYSLGATLCAVLTGRPPVRGGETADILDRVRRGEIDRPAAINRRVPKPLEAVCLKALKFDPADRYPSVRALADDLEHWMADQPVSVYTDPVATRLFRWARQHKPFVAASLALLVTAVVGLAVATAVVRDQKNQAEVARGRALDAQGEAERALARAHAARELAREHLAVGLNLVDQLVSFGDRQVVSQTSTEDRNRFLETAVVFIRRFREREPDDLKVQRQTAQVARRLANLYCVSGKFDQAVPFHDEAVAILSDLASGPAPDPSARDLLAEALIDQGDSCLTRGRTLDAERGFLRALELARANQQAAPDRTAYRRTLGRALGRLAAARGLRGADDALDLARQALGPIRETADATPLPRVRDQVISGHPLALADQLTLAEAQSTLAEALGRAHRADDAETLLRQSLGRLNRVARQFHDLPPLRDVSHAQARAAARLARALLTTAGDEARGLLDGAVERLRDLVAAGGEILQYQVSLADALSARARVHERAGRVEAAEADARAARAVLDPLCKAFPEVPEPPHLRAEVFDTLARTAERPGPKGRTSSREWLARAVESEQVALALCPDGLEIRERLDGYRKRLDALGP